MDAQSAQYAGGLHGRELPQPDTFYLWVVSDLKTSHDHSRPKPRPLRLRPRPSIHQRLVSSVCTVSMILTLSNLERAPALTFGNREYFKIVQDDVGIVGNPSPVS